MYVYERVDMRMYVSVYSLHTHTHTLVHTHTHAHTHIHTHDMGQVLR